MNSKKLLIIINCILMTVIFVFSDFNIIGYANNISSNTISTENNSIDYSNLPSYSSLEKGYVSSVKNQGNYNTCWAHSLTACAETYLIKNNNYLTDINFSELHLAYYHFNDAYDKLNLLKGDSTKINEAYNSSKGNFLMTGCEAMTPTITLARWTGLVEENTSKKFSQENMTLNFTDSDHTNAYSQDFVHMQNAYWIDTSDIQTMKEFLSRCGACQVSYYDASIDGIRGVYYNTKYKAYCYLSDSKDISTNHAVTIVGWDDNFSRTNFKKDYRPNNDGAWLVKNTWGSYWGDKGYFWISYEDSSLLSNRATFFEFEDSKNYDNNYQYDGSSSFEQAFFAKKVNTANVFTADSKEVLKAVSFFTTQEDVEYEVRIYTDLTDESNPVSGNLNVSSIVSDTLKYPGYHTIKLPNEITLDKNEKYSVVVSLYAKNAKSTAVLIDKTRSTEAFTYTNTTHPNESFLMKSYSTFWEDVSSPKNDGYNFRIKAFTDEITGGNDIVTVNDKTVYFYDIYGFNDVYALPFNSVSDQSVETNKIKMTFCGYDKYNTPVYSCEIDSIHNNSIYFMNGKDKQTSVIYDLNTFNVYYCISSYYEGYILMGEYITDPLDSLNSTVTVDDFEYDKNIIVFAALPKLTDGTEWSGIQLYYGGYGTDFDKTTRVDMQPLDETVSVRNIFYSNTLKPGEWTLYYAVLTPKQQSEIQNSYFFGFCENDSERKTFFAPKNNILYANEDKYSFYGTTKMNVKFIDGQIFILNDSNVSVSSEEHFCGYWMQKEIPYADINNDGIISMVDVIIYQQYLSGTDKLSDYQIYAGDVNKDNVFNMQDIVEIQMYIAELISKLPN